MKTSDKIVYIYGLVDPVSNKIRYVGKSIDPEARLEQHIKDQSHIYKTHWIRSLLGRGLAPTCTILEIVKPGNDWEASERYWIGKGYEEGWPLTNFTSGGEGLRDPSPEVRTKMSAAKKGKKLSEEHKYKIGAASKNRTEEYRLKMSKVMRGKRGCLGYKHSEETRRRMSKAKMGHSVSKETRDKISKIHKGKIVSEATKQKRRGENNPNAKLTSKEVLEIRHLIGTGCVSKNELAIAFDVSMDSIYKIAGFRTWKHLRE